MQASGIDLPHPWLECIEQDSHNADLFNTLAYGMPMLQKLEATIECFDYFVASNPGLPGRQLKKGITLPKAYRHEMAIAQFNTALKLRPTCFFDAYYSQSNGEQVLHQTTLNQDSYKAASATEPDFVHALVNCAKALQDFGHNEDALADYDISLAEVPNKADGQGPKTTLPLQVHRLRLRIRSDLVWIYTPVMVPSPALEILTSDIMPRIKSNAIPSVIELIKFRYRTKTSPHGNFQITSHPKIEFSNLKLDDVFNKLKKLGL